MNPPAPEKFLKPGLLWQQRRVRIVVKSLLGVFSGLILLGFFAVPPVLRWAVENQGSKALGRSVTVQGVSFNPLALSARIEGLRILEADGKSEFLSLGLLRANLSTASIWQRGVVLDSLRVEQPAVHVVRLDDNRFNFSDILERFASPPAPKEEPASEPARFSLNNIELTGGRIEFDDRPAARVHKIEQLNIGVPFVSSLPAKVENFVQPKLEANINGSDFRLLGQVKPFSDHRQASLEVVFEPFDITQYLGYVPAKLPVKIERAKLASDLKLVWTEASAKVPASLVVSGKLALNDVLLKDGKGGPLFDLEALGVEIERIEPLANPLVLRLNRVQIDGPGVDLQRAKNGTLNLATLTGEKTAPAGAAQSAGKTEPAKANAPRIYVDKLVLSKGSVRWQDDAVPGGYRFALSPLEIQLDKLDLAGSQPATLQLKAQGAQGLQLAVDARLALKDESYNGHFAVSGVALEPLRPYYAAALDRAIFRGETVLEGDFKVEPGKDGSAVSLDKLVLDTRNFSLSELKAKQPLVSVPESRAEGVSVDLAHREVKLGRFTSKGAKVSLLRDKDGGINLAQLFQTHSAANESAKEALRDKLVVVAETAVAVAPPAAPELPWRLSLEDAVLGGWAVHFDDRSGSAPVALDIADFGLHLKGWSNQPGAQTDVNLSARVNKAGKLAIGGRFGTEPLKGALRLDLRAVDFLAVQPYVDDLYRILVTRGNLSAKGNLSFDLSRADQPDIRYAGSLAVDDFNSLDRLNDADFMRWKHFAFADVKLQTRPLAFATREIRLEDFYTRLILDAQGRLNVRELAADEEAPGAAAPAVASAPFATGSTPSPAPKPAAPLPEVKIERIVLVNGNVNYTDRFIKPNYEANLLALNGTLTGLSSDQASVAALDLKASLDGAAPVTVGGELNPFRQDSFLDIKADVRDVDLTGVSTYAAKFVGYGIDKGKLSMAVQYKIRERQLSAENRVTLDQLTFGKKVESPDATKLPVLFAVSLLKDRHGVIDIKLPIAGSLDDPQFSVGGIILKVIGNLIGKAATAPFALIGSMFGGGEELAYLDFAPGSAAIAPAGEEKLRNLVKALTDRPALKLEIAGRADPAGDVAGLKRTRLDGKLRSLKAAQLVKRGEAVSQVDELKIDAAEYPALLKSVYEAEKIDGRPRNAVGMLKSLPVEDMERIVLGSFLVSPADLQALAAQRAQVVRTRLLDQTGVAPERVFLLSSANATEGSEGKPPAPRVEFSLR
ncbi:DUF748 domain-containing protein [Uliginosibacterium sp. 31-16]|uniref:DUF748 domain-containing protein n=1 Tax=Uliginosibacterium sp. 31-16 TaxID=3068315 RepID=UPI00273DF956|nr:DUF748 domain-containing protein [Uliginosibacterium sp. 31-16]MDP5239582.1 DUF748 domain-containing protein [Uliginosibacterium sp. 31-16]